MRPGLTPQSSGATLRSSRSGRRRLGRGSPQAGGSSSSLRRQSFVFDASHRRCTRSCGRQRVPNVRRTSPFVAQTRLEVLEIDRDESNLGCARVRLTHRPAFEAPSLGPGIIFGGVAHGGDGFIIVGPKIIRIPLRSPLFQMLEQLALYESSESITSFQTRSSVRRDALSVIAALADQQLQAMPVFREPAQGQKMEEHGGTR
jgi:hypothetical protein